MPRPAAIGSKAISGAVKRKGPMSLPVRAVTKAPANSTGMGTARITNHRSWMDACVLDDGGLDRSEIEYVLGGPE